jgi:CBS domain-containing membrane protein
MRTTRVSDVMTSIVEVLQIGDTLELAARLMRAGRIRHLPVVDGEQTLIGLVTQRKLLAAFVSDGDAAHPQPGAGRHELPVEMIMVRDVLTTWPDAPASEAAGLIETHRIGCVPVLDEGKVVGIVTAADFVKFARLYFEREDTAL